MYNLLICDDEKDIVNALKIYLSDPSYELYTASNGEEALRIVEMEDIHLVLMDIMMPVKDGMTALSEIRKISNVPVIFLTAKSEDTDKILGLNIGADDYITKPFNPVEVCARVRSHLRRYFSLGGGNVKPETFVCGDILRLLLSEQGRVFSPKEIYKRVWNDIPLNSDNTVAVHIRHLREKIEINPSEPRYLKVLFGQGYMIEKVRDR